MQILHKLNYTAFYLDIVQRDKIWAIMLESSKKKFEGKKNGLEQL